MGLLDWLRRKEAGEESPPLTFESHENTLEGLDMKGAIDAHMQWRERLTDHLHGKSQETLEVGTVSCDDNCTLGKWIYSSGKRKFSHLRELEDLRLTHADFHLCAGEVLLKHENDEKEAAEQLLNTRFKHLSGQVQLALVRLHTKASVS
ncbi:MAG: hypothetical protein QG662_64 [Pseudomonadota bacterium]|nr:hypothetical protein [Pseudomonadota bacterium]